MVSDPFPVQPGDCIEFLAWVHGEGARADQPCVFVEAKVDDRWQVLAPRVCGPLMRKYEPNTWDWTPRGASVFAPEGAVEAQAVVAASGRGRWYVDDFECRVTSFARYLEGRRGTERLPDIALIVVDAQAQGYMSCYDDARNQTPNMDLLAREGVRFVKVTTASPWTKPSFGSVFTSKYPSQHTAELLNSPLPKDLTTLAEALKARGYFTAGFVRSPYDGYIGPGMDFDQGFDIYFFSGNEVLVFETMLRFLDTNMARLRTMDSGGLFVFWHAYEPHAPYQNNKPSLIRNKGLAGDVAFNLPLIKETILSGDPSLANEEDVRYVRACYASETSLVDERLGQVLARLRSAVLYDGVNVVLTADHGESFGEKEGVWFHCHPYLTSTQIPLILRFPARLEPRVEERALVSNLDIMPTLLALAGAPIPAPCEGRNLLPADEGPTAKYGISEDLQNGSIAVRGARFKLVANKASEWADPEDYASARWVLYCSDAPTQYELYDLEADPLEETDLAERQPAELARLKQVLDIHCERMGISCGGAAARETPDLHPETIEALKAMGYLEGEE